MAKFTRCLNDVSVNAFRDDFVLKFLNMIFFLFSQLFAIFYSRVWLRHCITWENHPYIISGPISEAGELCLIVIQQFVILHDTTSNPSWVYVYVLEEVNTSM